MVVLTLPLCASLQDFWTYRPLPVVQFFPFRAGDTNVLVTGNRTLWVRARVALQPQRRMHAGAFRTSLLASLAHT